MRTVVNGRALEAEVEPRRLLADFLREDAHLYGTHLGCEHGVCGACTVLVDGEPVRSCLMLAVQADGHEVTTVEGLRRTARLHRSRRRSGTTTRSSAGSAPRASSHLASPAPGAPDIDDEDEIREALAGNLCRCTGYTNIVDAVRDAAGRLRGNSDTEKG